MGRDRAIEFIENKYKEEIQSLKEQLGVANKKIEALKESLAFYESEYDRTTEKIEELASQESLRDDKGGTTA